MTHRARLFGVLAILVGLLLLAAVTLPKVAERRIRALDAADSRFALHGVRVSPFLRVTIDAIDIQHPRLSGRCTSISARPALIASLRAPSLHALSIERCDTEARPDLDPSEPVDDSDEPTSYDAKLQRLVDQLSDALDRVDSLDVRRWDHTQTLDTYTVHLRLDDLSAESHPLRRSDWRATVSSRGAVAFENARLYGKIKRGKAQGTLHIDDAIALPGVTLTVGRVDLEAGRILRAEALDIRRDAGRIAQLTLDTAELHLDSPPRVELRDGALYMRDDSPGLAGTILADATPPEASDERGRRGLNPDEVAAVDDVWTLRNLARAQRLVQRLDALLSDTSKRQQLPIALDVSTIALVQHGATQMTLETLSVAPGEALHVDVAIGHAQLQLRENPTDGRAWTLDVKDASLSRVASFLELGEHVSGRLDAHAEFRIEDAHLYVKGRYALRDARLEHAAVSPKPIEHVQAAGSLTLDMPALASEEASIDIQLDLNGLPLDASIRFVPEGDRARVVASAGFREAVACQQVWEAVPAGLIPDLSHKDVRFSGRSKTRFSLNYLPGAFDSFTLAVDGFPGTCTIQVDAVAYDPRRLNRRDYTHHVTEGVTQNNIIVGPGTKDYVPIQQLPSYVPAVMYLSEEVNFYENHGISLGLLNKAIRHSLPRRRFAYGGSTVTQQLVKNLYFTRNKTLARKFQEAVIVWAVETSLTKDRILELYLNCIEFGPDLYGIVRASRHYFDKEPSALTPLEAAWLASLKPSPGRGRRDWQRGHSDFANWNSQRNEELLSRLVRFGHHIDEDEVQAAAPFVVYFPTSPNAGARPPGLDEAHPSPVEEVTLPADVFDGP